MQNFILAKIVLIGWLGACGTSQFHPADVVALIDEHRAQNLAQEQLVDSHVDLEFVIEETSAGPIVTAAFEDYPLARLTKQLSAIGGISYTVSGAPLTGLSSGEFSRVAAHKALAFVLEDAGYRIDFTDQTAMIVFDPSALFADLVSDEQGLVSTEISLTNLRAEKVAFSIREMADAYNVVLAPNTANNGLILSGSAEAVARIGAAVKSLDHKSDHILVEALIVEFNLERIKDIGSELADGQAGEFSNIFYDLIADSGGTLAFNFDSAAEVTGTSFGLALEFLVESSAAHVLSRPFLSTVSGETASLEIAEDRFVETILLDEAELNEVSSGVVINVTPTVLRSGVISLDYEISESRFAATEEELDLRRSKNSVTSSAIVKDGRTIVVGGLSLKTRARTDAGVPYAAKIPLLGSLVSHQANRQQDTEVMMFITPHIWKPGMDVPIPTEQAMRDHAARVE
ncbi:MAG: hypothetical protein ABJH52_05170 [Henriciella sp.]